MFILFYFSDIAVDILDPAKLAKFPVAVASSSDFFVESMLAISSIQRYLPDHDIIFYDLGLTLEEKETV